VQVDAARIDVVRCHMVRRAEPGARAPWRCQVAGGEWWFCGTTPSRGVTLALSLQTPVTFSQRRGGPESTLITRRSTKVSDQGIASYRGPIRPGWDAAWAIELTWLRADVGTQGAHAVVALAGDLDIVSAEPLGRRLDALPAQGFTRIVVDLAELAFCDASGLGILVKTAVRAAHCGGWLRLSAPKPMVVRIIDITNLIRVLPLYASVDDALAGRAAEPLDVVGA
jgi:anti-sigma B factor antagonist